MYFHLEMKSPHFRTALNPMPLISLYLLISKLFANKSNKIYAIR
jgi:hypothetical protein